MSSSLKMFLTAFIALLMLASQASAQTTMTINLTAPSKGQQYAPNAPINYAGNGSFAKTEFPLGKVMVQYVWQQPNANGDGTAPNTPTVGQGTLIDSDSVVPTCPTDANGVRTGTYTFENPVSPQTGKSTMTASQYKGNATYYYVLAYPFTNHNDYYYTDAADTMPLSTATTLGAVE